MKLAVCGEYKRCVQASLYAQTQLIPNYRNKVN